MSGSLFSLFLTKELFLRIVNRSRCSCRSLQKERKERFTLFKRTKEGFTLFCKKKQGIRTKKPKIEFPTLQNTDYKKIAKPNEFLVENKLLKHWNIYIFQIKFNVHQCFDVRFFKNWKDLQDWFSRRDGIDWLQLRARGELVWQSLI